MRRIELALYQLQTRQVLGQHTYGLDFHEIISN